MFAPEAIAELLLMLLGHFDGFCDLSNNYILSSRFLSRDSWRGPSQQSPIENKSE